VEYVRVQNVARRTDPIFHGVLSRRGRGNKTAVGENIGISQTALSVNSN